MSLIVNTTILGSGNDNIVLGITTPVPVWILATGVWNGNGVWQGSAVWSSI